MMGMHTLSEVWWVCFSLCVLAVAWQVIDRRQMLTRMISKSLWQEVVPSFRDILRYRWHMLLLGVIGLLLLALMQPKWGITSENVTRQGLQVMIVLDVSQSMLAQDIPPSRFSHARLEILHLLEQLNGDKIGLTIFSGNAFLSCPLTLDYAAFRLFLDDVMVGSVPRPGTNIAAAIRKARETLGRSATTTSVMIIISDGEAFEGGAVASAKKAKEWGIPIYTIGVGLSSGEPVPVTDDRGQRVGFLSNANGQAVVSSLDDVTLRSIASAGGGAYYHADGSTLVMTQLYKELAQYTQQLFEERLADRAIERYRWVLLPACLLLALVVIYRD